MKFGLNLYSIRNLIDTDDKFIDTCLKLKAAGYDFLQYSGIEFKVDKVKRELDEVGLPVYLTHVPMDRILNDTDALIKEHKEIGCRNIGLGGVFKPMQEFKPLIDKLRVAAKKISDAGLKFFYHNHMHEFSKDETGKTYYDYIIETAPEINFTLDTYWVQRGGVDFYDLVKRIAGRVDCVHLKDHSVILDGDPEKCVFINKECPCGDGTLDFHKMIPAVLDAGAKYLFVEQDNAAEKEDSLGEVIKSVIYLKNNF